MSEATLPRARVRERNEVAEWARSAYYLGIREVRLAVRTPAYLLPNILMPMIFFLILVGSLSTFAEGFAGGIEYASFQLPVAIIFAVTGGSAGLNLVTDIETGYFSKLLLTPTSRLVLILGAMGADFVRIVLQGLVIVAVGMAIGTTVETGVLGGLAMVGIASIWGLAYSAIGFAVALKTGSSQVVGSMWAFQFPLLFLAPTFAPKEALEGWLATAATYNPMTYFLDGLRALAMRGWDVGDIVVAIAIALGFGVLTLAIALRALLGRLR